MEKAVIVTTSRDILEQRVLDLSNTILDLEGNPDLRSRYADRIAELKNLRDHLLRADDFTRAPSDDSKIS